MKQAWEAVVAYKLVWLRVIFYFIMPMAMLFDTWSENKTSSYWQAMEFFDFLKLGCKLFIAGGAAFIAFLDQSYGRAKEELREKRSNGATAFYNKPTNE